MTKHRLDFTGTMDFHGAGAQVAQTVASLGMSGIKAGSRIGDDRHQGVAFDGEFQCGFAGAGMLEDIVKGFLDDE